VFRELTNDLFDQHVFDVFYDGRALMCRYHTRVGGNAQIDSRLFAYRFCGFCEALVYGDRDRRYSRIFGCYAGARTRGRAAPSARIAGDDEITFELLELMR
jgi:hypothetical protein